LAATFQWYESNGAGETPTADRADCNWKNIDDSTTAPTASPIDGGNNGFEKWMYGKFSGTFNLISAGLIAHTAGDLTGLSLTLKGEKAMTADADRLAYATPSTAANANLTFDATAITAIASGRAVWFGATGPAAAGKAASMATNPCYTNYLTHQLQVGAGATAGSTPTITITLRYTEN